LILVLDTNVWLDWLLFDDPSVAALKAAVAEGRAEVFIDAAGEAGLALLTERLAAAFPLARAVHGDRLASVATGLGVYAARRFG